MKNTSKIGVVVVLILVVLFGVGQFFTASAAPAAQNETSTPSNTNANAPATQVIAYQAMSNPAAMATSTPSKTGSCFTGSVAAPYRADAYRCMVGNAIADPCFVLPAPAAASGSASTSISISLSLKTKPQTTLLCGANPAGTDNSSTFVLKLTKPLPTASVPSGTVPTNWAWLVELNDGTVCSPYEGTRPFTAAGDVAVYACNGAAPGENMVFGDLKNASSVWTAEVGALSTATSTFPPAMVASATVPVYAVWQ